MAESALDRKLGRFTLEQILYAALLLTALFLRLFLLQQKPLHHDESIHAFFSWKITQSGLSDYKYDPVYHGPLLYYSTALIMWIFGDSDFTCRLSAALFGMGVLAFAWPLRRYIGRWGALCFLILLTFSPSTLYFSRFLRHDIYLALCNLAAVYWVFRYGETRQARYLYGSAVAFGLAFSTKEDLYLLTPLFLLGFAAMLVWEVLAAPNRKEAARAAWGETLGFFGRAWLPLITSLVIFLGIGLLFYTSFTTHPENWNPVRRALGYWLGQQQIRRIGGPWWYYVPQLVLYEPLIVFAVGAMLLGPLLFTPFRDKLGRYLAYAAVAALIGFAVALFRWPAHPGLLLVAVFALAIVSVATKWLPNRFIRFTVVWAIGSVCIYAWAQEKVPWLLVPQVVPLAILAGYFFGRLVESGSFRNPGTMVPVVAVGALTLWTMVAANYLYEAPYPSEPKDSRHAEMLVYVQSTYDVIKVMDKIREVGEELGTGTQTRLAVTGNATWPFSWYLRHYPVNWAGDVRFVDTPVVIVDKENTALDKPLAEKYTREVFEIRGWWEPDWKNITLPKLMRWLFTRIAWSGTGSSDALLFVHKDLTKGMSFERIAVNPPPAARTYPRQPGALTAEAVWGGPGAQPGEFNEPRGIAVDRNYNVYVVDSKNDRIQKLGPNGQPITVWGKKGSGQGEFQDPGGIALAPDGSVYVADTWNHRIQKFDGNGTFLLEWHEENPGFWGPRGVAVAADGTVYVTDTGNKRVLAYTPDGKRLRSWGKEGTKSGEFIEPVGIAVDDQGRVIVADTGNRRLQFFDAEGNFKQEWQVFGWEEFYSEPYLAPWGNMIYVTDSFNHRFALYTGSRSLAGVWGSSGTGRGQFNRPIGIAVDANGAVYVTDTLNHRVQKFSAPESQARNQPRAEENEPPGGGTPSEVPPHNLPRQ